MTTRKIALPAFVFALALMPIFFTCEKTPDYCGTDELYDPSCEFCFGSHAYPLCGNGKYNPLTGGCDPKTGLIGTRCSDRSVVPLGTPCGGYTLTLAATPESGGRVTRTNPEKTNFEAGDDVILSAFPNEGYKFAGWAGAQPDGGGEVAAYTMSGGKAHVAIVAVFRPSGSGKLITDAYPKTGGTVSRSPDDETYADGAVVTVTAAPAAGYVFAGWSGAETASPESPVVQVTMNESKTLVAMFERVSHTLSVSASPEAGGAVYVNGDALSGSVSLEVGSVISVLARWFEGYEFAGWEGDGVEFDNAGNPSATVTLRQPDASITANFIKSGAGGGWTLAPQAVMCTLWVENAEGGRVSLEPDGGVYKVGAYVKVTAEPEKGYTFTGWEGAAGGDDKSVVEIEMNKDKKLRANFQREGEVVGPPGGGTDTPATQYAVTVNGGTLPDGASRGSYADGATVGIKAATPNGQLFTKWVSNDNVEFFEVNKEVTTFKMPPRAVTVTANFESLSAKPGVPSDVNASATPSGGITVGWSPVSGAAGYYVYRSTSANGTYGRIGAVTGTSYNDKAEGLSPNTTYYYKVSAYNSLGTEGETSTYDYATTTGSPTAAGFTIKFDANGGSVTPNVVETDVNGKLDTWPEAKRDGYEFLGWFTAAKGGDDVSKKPFTASVTVYAQWRLIETTPPAVSGDTIVYHGEKYGTVVIGGKRWMAKNLNYDTADGSGSWCYDDKKINCEQYGRLYDWATAMGISKSYNTTKWGGGDENHRGICPYGWHVPSNRDWDNLVTAAGGGSVAGKNLKSTGGWNNNGNGTNEYGFSALPGGYRSYYIGSFFNVGNNGAWWTASEDDAGNAYYRIMGHDNDNVEYGYYYEGFSGAVRCVEN